MRVYAAKTVLCAATAAALACGASAVPAAAAVADAAASRTPRATVWAVGDAYPNAGGRRLAALVRRARPDLFLYLGDVYETGTAREFIRAYDALYGSLASRTLPTIGNHEYANRQAGYEPYWARKRGSPMPPWMKRRIAGWEILMLNSEAPHDSASEQARWLRRAVRMPGTCRIALTHRPRFSTGGHSDQADMEPLWRLLRGRARILLSGHDHDLQRLADHDGIRQIVSGAGGRANLPLPRRSAQTLRFAHRWPPGAVRLSLSPGRARIGFVDGGGRLLDRSEVTCRRLRG